MIPKFPFNFGCGALFCWGLHIETILVQFEILKVFFTDTIQISMISSFILQWMGQSFFWWRVGLTNCRGGSTLTTKGWYKDVSFLPDFPGKIFLFSQQIWNFPMKFGFPWDDLMLESSISLHVDVPNQCRPHDLVKWLHTPELPRQLIDGFWPASWWKNDSISGRIACANGLSLIFGKSEFEMAFSLRFKIPKHLRINCKSHTWDTFQIFGFLW